MKLFEGTKLNPNTKIATKISWAIIRNNGYCPCNQEYNDIEETKCPCLKYRTTGDCCCNLYVKE